ncbi:Rab guanine nucleotide exchange factor SEC2 [Microdochium nivale]|nr:Rab guanine nucleotide exchange factor SEC2 [Microdochium nivale]
MMHPPYGSPHTPRRMPSSLSVRADEEHNTIPDPRSRALSPDIASLESTSVHHPDLDQEVATLSTKLINAINHQTTLDDTLSSTRHELDEAQEKIAELEELVSKQQEKLSGDIWMRRSVAEEEKIDLRARLATERIARLEAEKEKRKIEQELENLTVSLFEEANNMVITAKEDAAKEQEILHRKNEQLKAQLKDTEGLLRFQQEQLTELKLVMEQMNAERDDRTGTAPSSPGLSKFDPRESVSRVPDNDAVHGTVELISPTYPTDLSHLLTPVLRTDIAAYDDFVSLIKTSKTHSRVSSGSYNGLNPVFGIVGASIPSNGSTTSLSAAAASSSSPQTPNTPASAASNGSHMSTIPLPALKETKFYKRALTEDIEPTLRLDTAPGLSWLARRSVITAITEGALVVEPVPTTGAFATISKPQYYKCSLCGESRKDEGFLRYHRFRTSESETAQRYPLCKYCLGRVRSTCDFLGFLRMVKDGHWRAEDADAERNCWEESVKLREQMFWSRIGGGVVPANHGHTHHGSVTDKSVRASNDISRVSQDGVPVVQITDKSGDPVPAPVLEPTTTTDDVPKPVTTLAVEPAEPVADCARTSGKADSLTEEDTTPAPPEKDAPLATATPTIEPVESGAEVETPTPPEKDTPPSVATLGTKAAVSDASFVQTFEKMDDEAEDKAPTPPEKDQVTRLSITIPGAFAFNV